MQNENNQPKRFLRRPAVSDLTGLPESTLYALMAAGRFPRSVKIGPRASAWIEGEVVEWQKQRLAERDGVAA